MRARSASQGFVLATSRPEVPPPRSILKKPSSTPASPSPSTPSSPLQVSPPMSPSSCIFAISGYRPQQWSVVGIAKAQHRPSKDHETKSICLIVTLLYVPTETLYAWPFNLTSPEAKGVCFETHSAAKTGEAARIAPEGTMSISLRVLADVIRKWMTIRRDRSALARHRGSVGSYNNPPVSPVSSVDAIVDDDEVIDEIIDTLRLHQLTPFERSIYLLRQSLPQEPIQESSINEQHPRKESIPSPGGRSDSSLFSLDDGSDEVGRGLKRRTSSISSRSSSTDASPHYSPQSEQASLSTLPKINTALPVNTDRQVPQISVEEATPQGSVYEERNRVLNRAIHDRSHDSNFGGRSMDTVHEGASESDDTLESAPTYDSNARGDFKGDSVCPATVIAAVSNSMKAASGSNTGNKPSPSKVVFRDPFQGASPSLAKPADQAQVVDEDISEIQVTSTARGKPSLKTSPSKRPSLSGLRSIFGGRSKSQ